MSKGCGRQHRVSIIIDLALASDYYTLGSVVLDFDLIVDFVGRHALDHFDVHRGQAAGCFAQRWHAVAKRRILSSKSISNNGNHVNTYHSPQCVHWPSQCFRYSSRRRFFWIATRRMNGTTFNENAHENEEQNAQ